MKYSLGICNFLEEISVKCIYVYKCYVCFLDWPFYYYMVSSLSFLVGFVLNSVLSGVSTATL